MQEPHFGAFLHHFLSNPRKAVRIRGARRIARVRPAGFSPGGAGVPDVVLRSPLTLVPSSSSTTSLRSKAAPALEPSK